ncbi:TauD/TfdA family dioxygenase [Gottfriedia sp. NPDC057991]|uniref:TauD/TfdA family dioxygenase n=1 Tax=Gottfriedia sp. NPDC057991 TaxID=3346298 RepID=UPI0036D86EFE
MNSIVNEKINHPSAWKGIDILKDDTWIYRLTNDEIEEIEMALRHVQIKGFTLTDTTCDFTKEDFVLPKFSIKLNDFVQEIAEGRGFVLIKGLPVHKYTEVESSIIFYALGLHMGTTVSQNAGGHLLGHVKSQGLSLKDTNVRGYQTTSHLPFHTDNGDTVGLLCLNKAKSGGHSTIVSALAIYNVMLEKYPTYLGLLCQDFFIDRRGEELPGESPLFRYPIFSSQDGLVTCKYVRGYIESAQLKTQARLPQTVIEALDIFDSLQRREDLRIDMDLEPGDMQFVSNYTVLHSRTEYEDYEDSQKWRHLLRLWLNLPIERPLTESVKERRSGIPTKAAV